MPIKYPPHHYTTSSNLQAMMETCFHVGFSPNSDCTIQKLEQKWTVIQPGNIFLIFFLSSFGEHVGIINSVSFSQLTYCIVHLENLFCKPLILTIGYLTFCCLHISSQQSAHSPLISCINKILVK